MRVTYLSVAVLDLAEIRSYIAVDTPDTAQQIGNQLAQAINRLSTFPNLGKPGRVEGTRELITPKLGRTAYVIVYRIRLERIEVLRVLSGMRDIDQILEEEFPNEENERNDNEA